MKQRFLQFAFLLANIANAAAYTPVQVGLIVKNHMRQPFSIIIDHQRMASNVNTFQFTGLIPGRHRVQVLAGNTYHTALNTSRGVLYDAWIDMHANETLTLNIQYNGLVYASSYFAPVVETYCHQPVYDQSCNYNNSWTPVYYGMQPDQFYELKKAVLNRNFDSTKRELLASALKTNHVTAAQLYELLTLLDFESSKVEIAKLGYKSVIDKENFFKVYNAFSFDSSVSELQNWIG